MANYIVLVVNNAGVVDDSIATPAGATTAAQVATALRPTHGTDTIIVTDDGSFYVDYPPTTAPSPALKGAIVGECKSWAKFAPGHGTENGDGGWDRNHATAVLKKDHRADPANRKDAINFIEGWLDSAAGVAVGNGGNGGNGGGNGGNGGNGGGNGGNGGNGGGNNGGGNSDNNEAIMRAEYQFGGDLYDKLRKMHAGV